MKPRVTAAITTCKRPAELVERALLSVISQSYQNMDVIVVNDYPEDADLVQEIARMIGRHEKKRQITYLVMERNGGACRARNRALGASQSDYIAFLDDDDEWLPDKIELEVDEALRHPEAALIYCNACLQDDEKKKRKRRFRSVQKSGDLFSALLERNVIGSCSYPLFRTDELKALNGFREDMPALQDWELYLRIAKDHEIFYVPKPLVIYHYHEGERISGNPEKRIEAFEKLYGEFREEMEENRKTASSIYRMGTYFYSFLDKKTARRYCLKAVQKEPFRILRNAKDFLRLSLRGVVRMRRV